MKPDIKKKIQNPHNIQQRKPAVGVIDAKKEKRFIILTLLAYVVVGLAGVFHHEMWRDELQTWLVAAASPNLGAFLHNMRTECNPIMWYAINFVISRFTSATIVAQLVHLSISVGSVYLILKYAPFSHLQKVLLSFGYYMLFEYTLIARGYALTVFFTFLFCAFYQIKSKNRYLVLSVILFLLPNTTGLHGIILTISLLGMMVTDYFFSEDTSIQKRYTIMQLLTGCAIALAGIITALECIAPVDNSNRAHAWFTGIDLNRMLYVLRTFWMSYLPIPDFTDIHFWNSNLFFQANTSARTFDFLLLIAFAIIAYCVLRYAKKLSIAVFYLAATCGIILACYTNNVILTLMAARHYGFMFIAFIAAAWLAPQVRKTTLTIPGVDFLRDKLQIEKNFTYLLTGLLIINMLGGVIAYAKDYTLPFSNIEKTATYITNHHLTGMPETGMIDYAVSPLSAYTGQSVYFPDRDTTCRFTCWTMTRFSFDPQVWLHRVSDFVLKQQDSTLLISTGDYFGIGHGKVIGNILFRPIASFRGQVVPDEYYILYIAEKFDVDKIMQNPNSFRDSSMLADMTGYAYNVYQNGKTDEAKNILLTIEEKTGGKIPYLHNYLGMIYNKENMPSEAEKEFKTEIALNLQKEEAFFNLGMLYYNARQYENAISSWDSAATINPKNSDALNDLGICFENYKKDANGAKLYFEKAIQATPGLMQPYYNLLACAQSSNDEATVIKYTRILLNKGVSVSDIKAKGINLPDTLLQKINAQPK